MRKKEETKRVEVYLPAEVADVVAREAKAEHLSLSGYCSVIIGDAVQALYNSDSPPPVDEEDEDYNETIHVQLRGRDAAILKRKAAELSFSPTRWVRESVMQKNLSVYWVYLQDLDEFLDEYGRHVDAIERIRDECKRTNSISKQDLELINEHQEAIRTLMLIHLSALLRKRQKAKLKLYKKNEE